MNVAAGERSGGLPLGFDDSPELGVGTPAHLRRDASHARAGEAVENEVARLSIVQNRPHDRLVGNFRVITVRGVNRIGLALADVDGEWLAAVAIGLGVVGLAVPLDKFR